MQPRNALRWRQTDNVQRLVPSGDQLVSVSTEAHHRRRAKKLLGLYNRYWRCKRRTVLSEMNQNPILEKSDDELLHEEERDDVFRY